jgi:hypothetical protein
VGSGRTCRGVRQDVPWGPAGRADEGPMKDPSKDPSKEQQQRPARVPLPPPPAGPDAGDVAHRLGELWREHRRLVALDLGTQGQVARLVADAGPEDAEALIRWLIESPDREAERLRGMRTAVKFAVEDHVRLLPRARAWAPPRPPPPRPVLVKERRGVTSATACSSLCDVLVEHLVGLGVDRQELGLWFSSVTPIGWDDDVLVLGLPPHVGQWFVDWYLPRLDPVLDQLVQQVVGPGVAARFELERPEPPALRVFPGGGA